MWQQLVDLEARNADFSEVINKWVMNEYNQSQIMILSAFTGIKHLLPTRSYSGKLNITPQVSVYAHSRPTDQNAPRSPKNKPVEAKPTLHTPRPTTHTECLWEHL